MTRRKARISPPTRRGRAPVRGPWVGGRSLPSGLKVYGYLLLVLLALALAGAATLWSRPLWVLGELTHLRLALKGFHNEYASVAGHRIRYIEGGHGRPVLLVHGLGDRSESWANLMPQLAAAGYHVYALDLLGYGLSDKPAEATYTIREEAGIVDAFLRLQDLEQVSLGGWSMGGWVAARTALDDPQRIARLMLFDAAGVRFAPGFEVRDFTPTSRAQLEHLYSLLMPHPAQMPDFLVRDVLRRGRAENWVIERSLRSMFSGDDLLDGKLGALKMPVLIVWGKDDHLLPPAMAIEMHREMPQSVLEFYDGCGHLAPGQCADRIGPRIVDFLNGRPPQANAAVEVPAVR